MTRSTNARHVAPSNTSADSLLENLNMKFAAFRRCFPSDFNLRTQQNFRMKYILVFELCALACSGKLGIEALSFFDLSKLQQRAL